MCFRTQPPPNENNHSRLSVHTATSSSCTDTTQVAASAATTTANVRRMRLGVRAINLGWAARSFVNRQALRVAEQYGSLGQRGSTGSEGQGAGGGSEGERNEGGTRRGEAERERKGGSG